MSRGARNKKRKLHLFFSFSLIFFIEAIGIVILKAVVTTHADCGKWVEAGRKKKRKGRARGARRQRTERTFKIESWWAFLAGSLSLAVDQSSRKLWGFQSSDFLKPSRYLLERFCSAMSEQKVTRGLCGFLCFYFLLMLQSADVEPEVEVEKLPGFQDFVNRSRHLAKTMDSMDMDVASRGETFVTEIAPLMNKAGFSKQTIDQLAAEANTLSETFRLVRFLSHIDPLHACFYV